MTDIEKKPKKVKNSKRDGTAAPDAMASPAKAVKSPDADVMKTKKKRKPEAEAGEAVPAAEVCMHGNALLAPLLVVMLLDDH